MDEFALIRQYFAAASCARSGGALTLGIGDDCALLAPAENHQLAISTDTLIEGVHFPKLADPSLLAQRALAVTVSDLAAMGAEPLGFTLALTLPTAEQPWLKAFAEGLNQAAEHYQIRLIGGDTTRGPLSLTLTVLGQVPNQQALLRSGAQVGDLLCVSGVLGAAHLALPWVLQQANPPQCSDVASLLSAYWQPTAQIALGQALRGKASAALDISDGLLADAAHIARASAVGLEIQATAVPCVSSVAADLALIAALTGGDDYHLLFTLPANELPALVSAFPAITVIGKVVVGEGVALKHNQQSMAIPNVAGYRHF